VPKTYYSQIMTQNYIKKPLLENIMDSVRKSGS